MMIKLETKNAFLNENFADYQDSVTHCHELLMTKKGKGNDYTGWVEWPFDYDKEEFAVF